MKYFYLILFLIYSQWSFALGDKPYNTSYDPARDPFVDFIAAKADAKAQNKLILLEFGGNWCIWCRRLDKFISDQPEISKNMSEVFIVLKINVSEENGNVNFLKQFSNITGYPHFIITNASGEELAAVNTGTLEKGKGYSALKMQEFIDTWKQRNNSANLYPQL
jgi:thiol:disulfide interchange protein